MLVALWLLASHVYVFCFRADCFHTTRCPHPRQCRLAAVESDENEESWARRAIIFGLPATALLAPNEAANAAGFFKEKLGLYVIGTKKDVDEFPISEEAIAPVPTLSSEYTLLELLPVKNPVFRTLESNIKSLSVLRFGGTYNVMYTKFSIVYYPLTSVSFHSQQ